MCAPGRQLAELTDATLQNIRPLNKPHPHMDVVIHRSLYAWSHHKQHSRTTAQAANSAFLIATAWETGTEHAMY
jgi:hypothetical protein